MYNSHTHKSLCYYITITFSIFFFYIYISNPRVKLLLSALILITFLCWFAFFFLLINK